MEWLDDSKACLDVAQTMLKELEGLIQESLIKPEVVPFMKVKIKNCLENCRSPLDYAANYIFDTYCKSEYTERELKKKKTYFPIRYQEKLFEICIREDFRKLPQKRPDIVEVLKKIQSFNGDPWLQNLTKLINENKHRNLTKQAKEQITTIKNAQIGGIILENFTTVNVETPIQIDNTKVDFINPSPLDHLFDASVQIEYFFEDIGLSVLPTLSRIYDNAYSLILELENTSEGI